MYTVPFLVNAMECTLPAATVIIVSLIRLEIRVGVFVITLSPAPMSVN